MTGFRYVFLIVLLFVTACSLSSNEDIITAKPWGESSSPRRSQRYVIKSEGGSYKVGNPYKIFGTTYYPKEDYSYSEIGTASWYGKDFHAKTTANGEKYNMNALTAAHRTLPLPSIVKVTNLENGRTVILRVNDRGPYAKNRIIDISKRGAEILGFQTKGTAKVKVEIFAKESKNLKNAMLNRDGKSDYSSKKSVSNFQSSESSGFSPSKILAQKVVTNNSATTTEPKIPTTKSGKYVQAGSFSSYSSAVNLKNELENIGKTDIYSIMVDDSVFYRVRLGPYDSSKVEKVLENVVEYGVYNARIVSE